MRLKPLIVPEVLLGLVNEVEWSTDSTITKPLAGGSGGDCVTGTGKDLTGATVKDP
jgi:hypothetical protein